MLLFCLMQVAHGWAHRGSDLLMDAAGDVASLAMDTSGWQQLQWPKCCDHRVCTLVVQPIVERQLASMAQAGP